MRNRMSTGGMFEALLAAVLPLSIYGCAPQSELYNSDISSSSGGQTATGGNSPQGASGGVTSGLESNAELDDSFIIVPDQPLPPYVPPLECEYPAQKRCVDWELQQGCECDPGAPTGPDDCAVPAYFQCKWPRPRSKPEAIGLRTPDAPADCFCDPETPLEPTDCLTCRRSLRSA